MSFRSLLVSLCLSLVAVSPALAQPRAWPEGATPVVEVDGLDSQVQLVGSRVAWLDSNSRCVSGCAGPGDFTERQRTVLRITRPGGKPSVLYRADTSSGTAGGEADSFGGQVDFGLSVSHLAILTSYYFEGRGDSSSTSLLLSGPRPRSAPEAQLRRTSACSSSFDSSGPGSAFALSGSLLVYDGTPCGRDPERTASRFTVRNLSNGTRRSESLPGQESISGLAAAGRFVAVLTSFTDSGEDEVPVQFEYSLAIYRDDREGALATAIVGDSYVNAFDIQRDGRVAVCSSEDRLLTFSPAEPQPRDLGSCLGPLRISADRVVLRAPDTDGIAVSDLAGRRTIAAALGRISGSNFDFDGRTIAFAIPMCSGRTTILRTPLSNNSDSRPYLRCPVRIRSRGDLAMIGRRATRIALRCPRGCSGAVELYGARDLLSYESFERGSGPSTVKVRLSRHGLRALRRSGNSLRVKLKVTVDDRGGEDRALFRKLQLTR